MAIEIDDSEDILTVRMSGKLSREDYERLAPTLEGRFDQGSVRMLVELHDFHGWSLAAAWEDTKFGMHHFKDIERIAMVGETAWQHGMATFCKPFTGASLKYFDGDTAAARAWLLR